MLVVPENETPSIKWLVQPIMWQWGLQMKPKPRCKWFQKSFFRRGRLISCLCGGSTSSPPSSDGTMIGSIGFGMMRELMPTGKNITQSFTHSLQDSAGISWEPTRCDISSSIILVECIAISTMSLYALTTTVVQSLYRAKSLTGPMGIQLIKSQILFLLRSLGIPFGKMFWMIFSRIPRKRFHALMCVG